MFIIPCSRCRKPIAIVHGVLCPDCVRFHMDVRVKNRRDAFLTRLFVSFLIVATAAAGTYIVMHARGIWQ